MSTLAPAEEVPAANSEAGTDAVVPVLLPRTSTSERVMRVAVPVVTLLLVLVLWQVIVVAQHIPKYILPSPIDVAVA
ncbi:MAG: Hydroxymethylpyrimidine transporter, transrane component, partial [Hyphomicrobiales bacterium]|nr:Hydroxymethylpyrimidine transporter, transrane component [Hyphomicrobiales bacterium]